MPRGAMGLIAPDEPEFEARITCALNAVERFWLEDHGVQVLESPNSVRLIFPDSTQKLFARTSVTTYDGIEIGVVTSVPYVFPDRTVVCCRATEGERGVPTFETSVEIHAGSFDRYRLLTSPVTGKTLVALQREGVRIVDLATVGQIIVFPEGTHRRTTLPEYTVPDGHGPDISLPGSFMRSLEFSLPSGSVCILYEQLARPEADESDFLEYRSYLDRDWDVEDDPHGVDEANHLF